jgi:hypothetical protein
MRQPPDEWRVYGWVDPRTKHGARVSESWRTEEEAWEHLMRHRLRATDCGLMLIHIRYRPHKTSPGHWRPVHNVLIRIGDIKGWWE